MSIFNSISEELSYELSFIEDTNKDYDTYLTVSNESIKLNVYLYDSIGLEDFKDTIKKSIDEKTYTLCNVEKYDQLHKIGNECLYSLSLSLDNAIDEKYKMLVYFLLNFKNEDTNYNHTISKTVKNENFLVIMEKIFKREKLEMNPKFILTFYKKLHRKRNNAENVINKINRELSLQNDENLKIKKSAEQDKIEFYDIAESSINFENKNFPSKQIVKKYVDLDKVQKISTLILVDLEEKEILKVYNKVSKIFNFINIVKVERLDKFKKIITKNNDEFEQILLISSSKFISIIFYYTYKLGT